MPFMCIYFFVKQAVISVFNLLISVSTTEIRVWKNEVLLWSVVSPVTSSGSGFNWTVGVDMTVKIFISLNLGLSTQHATCELLYVSKSVLCVCDRKDTGVGRKLWRWLLVSSIKQAFLGLIPNGSPQSEPLTVTRSATKWEIRQLVVQPRLGVI